MEPKIWFVVSIWISIQKENERDIKRNVVTMNPSGVQNEIRTLEAEERAVKRH